MGEDGSARQHWWQPIMVMLSLVAAIYGVVLSWDGPRSLDEQDLDFVSHFVAAEAWLSGDNPYARTRGLIEEHLDIPGGDSFFRGQVSPHPPAHILLVAPLTSLDYFTARNLWLVLMTTCGLAAVALTGRALGWTRGMSLVAGAVVLALPMVRADLHWRQTNFLLLLLLVLAWRLLRAGRDVGAGVVLGVATAIKIMPIFLVVPLLLLGRRRAVVSHLVSATVLSVVASLALGSGSLLSFLNASSQNLSIWGGSPPNMSLAGIPFKLFGPSAWGGLLADAPLLAYAFAIPLVILCVVVLWKSPLDTSGDVFWAAAPLMIMASPLAWEHYAVLCLPLLMVTLSRSGHGSRPPLRFAIGAGLILLGQTGLKDLAALLGVFLPGSLPEIARASLFAWAVPLVGLILMVSAEFPRRRAQDRVPLTQLDHGEGRRASTGAKQYERA